MVGWCVCSFVIWFVGCLLRCPFVTLVGCLLGSLVGGVLVREFCLCGWCGCLLVSLVGWCVGSLVIWFVGRLVGVDDWLFRFLVGCLVSTFVCSGSPWFVGWSVGCLIGVLVGWSVECWLVCLVG